MPRSKKESGRQAQHTSPHRLSRAQKNRLILLEPTEASREKIFKSSLHPKSWQAFPDEIIWRIIQHLDDPSAVSLALTCHSLHDYVVWACQVPLDVVCPIPAPMPPKLPHYDWSRPQLIPPRDPIREDRARLFRDHLRDFMGIEYIYCGKPGGPECRRLFPAAKFARIAEEHKDCGCTASLVQREKELCHAEKLGKRFDGHDKLMKVIKFAQCGYGSGRRR